jgi:hypothetical protein
MQDVGHDCSSRVAMTAMKWTRKTSSHPTLTTCMNLNHPTSLFLAFPLKIYLEMTCQELMLTYLCQIRLCKNYNHCKCTIVIAHTVESINNSQLSNGFLSSFYCLRSIAGRSLAQVSTAYTYTPRSNLAPKESPFVVCRLHREDAASCLAAC